MTIEQENEDYRQAMQRREYARHLYDATVPLMAALLRNERLRSADLDETTLATIALKAVEASLFLDSAVRAKMNEK